jgi:hypothetical protein
MSAAIGEPGWRPTEVHPLATAFRMMTDDELANLADDIKEHGLRMAITVDQDGRLVDGRNRDAACARVGVEPRYQVLNGEDVAAFIVSLNIERRDLTKGQKAIGLAMIYPEPGKGGRGNKQSLAENVRVSNSRLTQARAILHHSRALAEQVREGTEFFDKALSIVEQARQASASTEARMARLRTTAPDVAALVDEERLTLEAGLEELKQRERATRHVIDGAANSIETLMAIAPHVLVLRSLAALEPADLALINLAEDDRKALLDKLDIDALKAAISDLEQLKRGRR